MNDNNQIKKLLNSKQSLIEVILIASLIGIGINFISTSVFEIFNLKHRNTIFLTIGGFLLILSAIYFAFKIFQRRKVSRHYKGFIVFKKEEQLPMECDGYEYSEELRRNFDAAFSENKALKHIWESDQSDPIDKFKIVIEATEYYLIDTLSTHLSDYFNNSHFNKNQIEELSRKHIPHVLLENRFLELFSKPMEQREQFIQSVEKEKKEKSVGKVIMSYGESGALFKDFDLVLPKKSTVKKDNNSFTIETPRFNLTFKIVYGGFGSVLPSGYVNDYLGFDSYTDQMTNQINLEVEIDYKWTSFFFNTGWNYYEWLDLFLEKIESEFSKNHYFKTIQWDTIYAQSKVINRLLNKK